MLNGLVDGIATCRDNRARINTKCACQWGHFRKYTDGIATGVATLPLNQRHPPTTWFHVKPIGMAWCPNDRRHHSACHRNATVGRAWFHVKPSQPTCQRIRGRTLSRGRHASTSEGTAAGMASRNEITAAISDSRVDAPAANPTTERPANISTVNSSTVSMWRVGQCGSETRTS